MGFTLNTALKDSSCTATTWYVQDSGGTQLATGSFSGDTATINYHFTNTTVFRLMCDAGGGSHTERYKLNSNSYPVDYTEFEMTATVDATTIETTVVGMRAWISVDVTQDVSATVTPSALTLSTTAQTPIVTVTITPSALTMTLSIQTPTIREASSAYVVVGTGQHDSKYLKRNWPITDGLTAGATSQTGHTENLIPEKSLIRRENYIGL